MVFISVVKAALLCPAKEEGGALLGLTCLLAFMPKT
eukprot:XP_001704725.1 Hypothetical protein GL50803_31153 [Giardia lamblia ATCC 50803]